MLAAGPGLPRAAGDPVGESDPEAMPGRLTLAIKPESEKARKHQGEHQHYCDLLDRGRTPIVLVESPGHAPKLGWSRSSVALQVQQLRAPSSSLVGLNPGHFDRPDRRGRYIGPMEGSPFNMFGDPDELRARMQEMADQMQSSQEVAWADNAIRLAVEMTVASIGRLELTGSSDEQAMQVRDAIRVVFPEAVTLVREARQGLR